VEAAHDLDVPSALSSLPLDNASTKVKLKMSEADAALVKKSKA